MPEKTPDGPWPYPIEKSGGNTTPDTYEAYEKAPAEGGTTTAQEIYDKLAAT